mgnify:CR=1 FL=1
MAIKIKNKDPRPTEFNIDDIVINTRTGTIFYKNEKNELFKVQGDNLNTITNEQNPDSTSVVSFSDITNVKQTSIVTFNADITSNLTSEIYLPFNSVLDSNSDKYYHFMLAPFDGQVKQITVGVIDADQSSLGTITLRTRKSAGNDFDLDDTPDDIKYKTGGQTFTIKKAQKGNQDETAKQKRGNGKTEQ